MSDWKVPAGDYGYNLNLDIQTNANAAYNLDGYTVYFKVWLEDGAADPVVNATCTADNASNGEFHYQVQSGDFDYPGNYYIEAEFTKANTVESTRSYTLEVTESA